MGRGRLEARPAPRAGRKGAAMAGADMGRAGLMMPAGVGIGWAGADGAVPGWVWSGGAGTMVEAAAPVLHGYRYSVYAWIARLVLREKGVAHGWREIDPFLPDVPDHYRALHPFGRVPVLVDGDFVLYETCAIARYVDEAFAGPALQPEGARARARMQQIVSVADSYAYRPLVRQVFGHGVFRPRVGRLGDEAEVSAGLAAAATVLDALDRLVSVPDAAGWTPTLADLHLAPMLGYFAAAPEGQMMLARLPRLAAWFAAMAARDAYRETEPALP